MSDAKKTFDFGDELNDLASESWVAPQSEDNSTPKPDLDQVREIAEEQGFTSREPRQAPQKEPEGQITIRGKQSVMENFRHFAFSQEPRWPLGYTLERALAALKRELG